MSVRLAWVRVSPDLSRSQEGRYVVHCSMGRWYTAHWTGNSWTLINFDGEDNITAAKTRAENHRWFGKTGKVTA